MGFVLLFLTGFFARIPFNVLAAIVIVSVSGLIEFEQAIYLWKVGFKWGGGRARGGVQQVGYCVLFVCRAMRFMGCQARSGVEVMSQQLALLFTKDACDPLPCQVILTLPQIPIIQFKVTRTGNPFAGESPGPCVLDGLLPWLPVLQY